MAKAGGATINVVSLGPLALLPSGMVAIDIIVSSFVNRIHQNHNSIYSLPSPITSDKITNSGVSSSSSSLLRIPSTVLALEEEEEEDGEENEEAKAKEDTK